MSTESSAAEVPDTAASLTDALSTETSPAPTPASDAPTSEAAGTDAEVVVARLAKDDPTCEALERVRKINDQSGALSNEFIAKALGAVGGGNPATIEIEFEKFLKEFVTLSDKIIPDLTDSYAVLAKEQPQFATDLDKLESVTVELIAAFKKMKASDLEKMEEFLAAQVSTDDMMAGGLAALKIDKFSRAACDIPFANT